MKNLKVTPHNLPSSTY